MVYAGTRTGSGSASGSVDADSVRMLPDDSVPMSAVEGKNVQMTPLSAAELRSAELMPASATEFRNVGPVPVSANQRMTPHQVIKTGVASS